MNMSLMNEIFLESLSQVILAYLKRVYNIRRNVKPLSPIS